VSSPCRGRIVWVELIDPQGGNPKRRPAVIVSDVPGAAASDTQVWVVAVSTQLESAPADAWVELPWHRDGHPKTKLKERCAAVCTWLTKVPLVSVQEYAGVVPGKQLLEILKKIGALPT
jgi:mRNA-degrading endonuclease toxin of MazEF toxin-antitoxin module